ncbi:hypothetical protein CCP4SC76_3260002 [Gammaproteobacteria bacterium]
MPSCGGLPLKPLAVSIFAYLNFMGFRYFGSSIANTTLFRALIESGGTENREVPGTQPSQQGANPGKFLVSPPKIQTSA